MVEYAVNNLIITENTYIIVITRHKSNTDYYV